MTAGSTKVIGSRSQRMRSASPTERNYPNAEIVMHENEPAPCLTMKNGKGHQPPSRSTEYVVEFATSQQPSIRGHQGAAKLEHQAAVEIESNSIRSRFTPWVRHGRLARSRVRC